MSTPTNAPTCDICGKRQAAVALFIHGAQRLCIACLQSAPQRAQACSRCGGAHTAETCDVPEGFRQFGEAKP
jgi:hypothetical protein